MKRKVIIKTKYGYCEDKGTIEMKSPKTGKKEEYRHLEYSDGRWYIPIEMFGLMDIEVCDDNIPTFMESPNKRGVFMSGVPFKEREEPIGGIL